MVVIVFLKIFFLSLCLFQVYLPASEVGLSGLEDAWVDPVDTTEEDLVIPSLQAHAPADSKIDPKFVTFLADVGGRLTLPQTYKSALSDLLISLRNDQMWKSDVTLRRAMLSLLHKAEVYGRRNGGEDLDAVDQMVKEAFELWPPGPDRPRIIGLMNSVSAFQERQKMNEIAAAEKVAKEAEKEALREKKDQAKLEKETKDAAVLADKISASSKLKPAKITRPRVAKPKAAPKEAVEDGGADGPVRRLRSKKNAGGDVTESQRSAPAVSGYVVPERFDQFPTLSEETRNVGLEAIPLAIKSDENILNEASKSKKDEGAPEVAP